MFGRLSDFVFDLRCVFKNGSIIWKSSKPDSQETCRAASRHRAQRDLIGSDLGLIVIPQPHQSQSELHLSEPSYPFAKRDISEDISVKMSCSRCINDETG